jgi:hypothetical protein
VVRRVLILGLVAAVAVVVGFGAGALPARAGAITAYADSSNCGILGAYTNTYDFSLSNWSTGCNPLEISDGNETLYPDNSYAQLISYAPAGIAITSASVSGAFADGGPAGSNWWVGSVWSGGGHTWPRGSDGSFVDQFGGGSSYWGMQMWCLNSLCGGASMWAAGVTLNAVEYQGPAMTAEDGGNIWYQGSYYGSNYVWNPPGDPWPLTLSATDPSGVCQFGAFVDNREINSPVSPRNQYAWQQCPNPNVWTPSSGAQIDTRTYLPGDGDIPLTIQATNAANVTSSLTETVNVDNDPVDVALTTPDDPNPSVWVNHGVTVDANASTGPSGLQALSCGVDGGSDSSYPASGVSVDGDGIHTVRCTATNNAVDPQGEPNSGSSSETIQIDEAPPAVGFEPQNPADPTQLAVDTSDSESGVAGGSIEMAPVGTQNWTSLPTSTDGQHLLARFNDASLRGPYVFRATSCDAVGNCAATSESLAMPLRLAARSDVSFQKIDSPAKIVRERVLVGWHYKRERRHGKVRRVRVGGHYRSIRVVIKRNAACATKRVKTGRHRWRELRACRRLKIHVVSSKRVGYGKPVTLHGLLITAQGAPLADAPVRIVAAPDNGLEQFAPVTVATTASDGTWSVTLPAGPSRIIKAIYAGSAYVLPVSGKVNVIVPAKIGISITPHRVPWANFIEVRGHLNGGHVPPDGVALRFLVRYPHSKRPTSLLPLRTNSRGQFAFTWSYNGGHGVATYPMSIATTATESDYPFDAARSRAIAVTFGVPTPARDRTERHHKRGGRWAKHHQGQRGK